jgi:hypothetical protein
MVSDRHFSQELRHGCVQFGRISFDKIYITARKSYCPSE